MGVKLNNVFKVSINNVYSQGMITCYGEKTGNKFGSQTHKAELVYHHHHPSCATVYCTVVLQGPFDHMALWKMSVYSGSLQQLG